MLHTMEKQEKLAMGKKEKHCEEDFLIVINQLLVIICAFENTPLSFNL